VPTESVLLVVTSVKKRGGAPQCGVVGRLAGAAPPWGHHYRSGHLAGARSPLLCTPPNPRPGSGPPSWLFPRPPDSVKGGCGLHGKGPMNLPRFSRPAHASPGSVADARPATNSAQNPRTSSLRSDLCARTAAPGPLRPPLEHSVLGRPGEMVGRTTCWHRGRVSHRASRSERGTP